MANWRYLGGEPVAAGGPRYTWPEYGDEERRALEDALTRGSWCRIMLSDEDSTVYHFEQEWAEFLGGEALHRRRHWHHRFVVVPCGARDRTGRR